MWFVQEKQKLRKNMRNSRLASYVAMAMATIVLSIAVGYSHAYALDGSSSIKTSIHDTEPASLVVASPLSGATVKDTLVVFDGKSHNVSQIMTYLDGAYYATTPLNLGSQSFSFSIKTTVGQHTIKLVAVDPLYGTQIESTAAITVEAPETTSAIVDNTVQQVGGVVIGAGTELKSQVDQASTWGPLKSITDASYNALKTLDLLPSTMNESVPVVVARFSLVSIGLGLTIAPWGASWLLGRLKFLPRKLVISQKMLGRLHVIGMVLFLIPFIFL